MVPFAVRPTMLLWCALACCFLCSRVNAQFFTLSGSIKELGSGESVVGATVALYSVGDTAQGQPIRGTIANRYGYYVIAGIPYEMEYNVVVTAIGFQRTLSHIKPPNPLTNINLDIIVVTASVKSREVVVTGDRTTQGIESMSTISITPEFITEMPAFGGEVDVFRVLQLLPGVQAASEISSGLYVRGGSADQNLVLLDGVIVYNPLHLGGILSAFHNDALRDVKLKKGSFPAEYGGRLSSVIDITMKEGNSDRMKGAAHASLLSAGLTLDGPIDSNSTYMVSGRRFYLDALTLLIPSDEEMPSYYFYDLNLKVNRRFGATDRLFISGYFGRDMFGFDGGGTNVLENDIGWGNKTLNIRWTRILNPGVFLSSSFIVTSYDFGMRLFESYGHEYVYSFRSSSDILDYTLRSEIEWATSADHNLKAGIELTRHRFSSMAAMGGDYEFNYAADTTLVSLDACMYIQDNWQLFKELRANVGMRMYWFQAGNWFRVEPRCAVEWTATESTSLLASFSAANQFLHMIVRNDIALPTDVWFPSTSSLRPATSLQGVLGMQTRFLNGEYTLSVEAYYKTMNNLLEFRDHLDFSLGIPLEEQFTSGKALAYGLELFLERNVGAFTGWLGYTLAWNSRTFAGLNNGQPFNPRYDRRHDVAIAMQYRLGSSWRLGATWVYGTGQAYSMPAGQYFTGSLPVERNPWYWSTRDFFTERNGWRVPAFHKLDLNFIHEFTWGDNPWELSLNVYNAYSRRNPFAVYLEHNYVPDTDSFQRIVKMITLFPILPSVGVRCTF